MSYVLLYYKVEQWLGFRINRHKLARVTTRDVLGPAQQRLHRSSCRLLPPGHENLILFAVVSICYRSESVCVFAVEPRHEIEELNWDTNGMDAVEGLSADATRPYNDHLLPCPDAKPARDAAPSRRVRDGGQCGGGRTDHLRDAQGRPCRHQKNGWQVPRIVVMAPKYEKFGVEAKRVVKIEERRLLYKHLIS